MAPKFAVTDKDGTYRFSVHAKDEEEALKIAKQKSPNAEDVEEVSEEDEAPSHGRA